MHRIALLAAGQLVLLAFVARLGNWLYLLSTVGALLAAWLYWNELNAGDERLRLRNWDALEYGAEIAGWAGAWAGGLLVAIMAVSLVIQLAAGGEGGLAVQWDTAMTTFERWWLKPRPFLGIFAAGVVLASIHVLRQGPDT